MQVDQLAGEALLSTKLGVNHLDLLLGLRDLRYFKSPQVPDVLHLVIFQCYVALGVEVVLPCS